MKDYIDDVLFFVGLGLSAYGLWIINPPYSYIYTGLILLLVSVLRSKNKGH